LLSVALCGLCLVSGAGNGLDRRKGHAQERILMRSPSETRNSVSTPPSRLTA
jgi:hypothetical protein